MCVRLRASHTAPEQGFIYVLFLFVFWCLKLKNNNVVVKKNNYMLIRNGLRLAAS